MNQASISIEHLESELLLKRILVVEDDPDIAELIRLHLQSIYQTVITVHNGLSGLQLALDQHWDLIVLDLRLPGKDGLEVCRELRSNDRYVPILMLTSKSSELDRVLGLEMGADDYVTKPFSVIELAARIKAIFRRITSAKKLAPVTEVIDLKAHALAIDLRSRKVIKRGQEVELTAKEFDLLRHFVQNPNYVFSRLQLLNKVWGYGHEGYQHTVNSHMNRLRAKIEDNPAKPSIITTVWGIGYKLGR